MPIEIARPLACQGYWAIVTSLGFLGGEAGPGDFGIGKHDGRYRLGFECGRVACENFGGDLSFVRSFVGEHRFAGDVADGEDMRVGGALLTVDFDEALFGDGDVGVLEAKPCGRGTAPDRNQDAIEFVGSFHLGALHLDFDLLAGIFEGDDFGIEMNIREQFAEAFGKRFHQVAVGTGEQGIGEFDDRDFGAELGIDGAHLEADIAAADHEHRFGDVGQLQGPGGVHHSIRTDGKHARHGGG